MKKKLTITPEQLDHLGQLVDRADNYLTYKDNKFITVDMKLGAYEFGLADLRMEIKLLYLALGGSVEWEGRL